jgi:hypothetical protein
MCWSMLVAGCSMLVAGYWLLDTGCWILVAGYWLLDTGCWILVARCSMGSNSEILRERALND